MDISEQAAMIKRLRQQYNLTARQVAEMAGVPLRVEYLMEIGCPVSADEAMKVMQALSILSSEHSELPGSRITFDGSPHD
jgi:transcriptional regulator with XRE-family HTH domain